MAVNDVCTLRVIGRYQSQNIVNTLHYRIAAQDSGDDEILNQLCIAWEADVQSYWDAVHSNQYNLEGLKAFRKTGTAKVPRIRTIDDPGTVDGTELPSYVCRTITLYTESTNFRRRGRVMLSGSVAEMFEGDDGGVTAAQQVALNSLGDALIDTLTVGDDSFQLCIPPTEVPEYPTEDITTAVGRSTPSSVRTRRIRQYLVG
jgi:hypothetical protein